MNNTLNQLHYRKCRLPGLTRAPRRVSRSSPRREAHRSVGRWGWALAGGALLVGFLPAHADRVTWEVDRTNSYLRLTIPDQALNIPDLGSVTLRIRDAGNADQWTDAGGRRATLEGQIATEYEDGQSIRFLGGSHNLRARETASLRPSPEDWSSTASSYTGTRTAPAAFGGRVRGTYVAVVFPVTFDAAYLALRDVQLNIVGVKAGPIALVNGTLPAGATQAGPASGWVDVDGLELPLNLGQPIPDIYHAPLSPVVTTNVAAGSVSDLGGQRRKLTYPIEIPDLNLDLNGIKLSGSAAGMIVAYATLPTPLPPPVLSLSRQDGQLIFSWPTNATGFTLQSATALSGANWLPVSPAPGVVGEHYVVTNVINGPVRFYRLHKP